MNHLESRPGEELIEDLFVAVIRLEMSGFAEVDEADVRKPLDEPRGRRHRRIAVGRAVPQGHAVAEIVTYILLL